MPMLVRSKRLLSGWQSGVILPLLLLIIDTSHALDDGYSTVITVDKQAGSVDYALMGIVAGSDTVVTQDYGLAAMVLGKGARAVNQKGSSLQTGIPANC